ncbi:RHS repeat-associated core domain-containing protein [Propionibacteriaceae bacterium G1746]
MQDWTGNPVAGAAVPCTVRTYGFDTNGNRTSQGSTTAVDGTCSTPAPTTTTRVYDVADRPTTGANGTGGYVYDQLGRQTSLPAIDSPEPAGGPVTLGYHDHDTIASISQGGTSISFTLDTALRRKTQTTTTTAGSTTLVRHYTDGSGNSAWSVTTTGGHTSTTRYTELIGGDLGLSITTTSTGTTAQLAVSGPRGDMVSEITLPTDATTPDTGSTTTGLDWWHDYDEYGQPKHPTTPTTSGTSGIGYGWLGTKQRATTTLGLTLMGARLYNPTTATFTSPDPIHGGNDTTCGYPNDPINHTDINGQESSTNKAIRHAVTVKTCRSFGWRKCAQIVAITALAARLVPASFGGSSNKSHAVRHFVWMGLLYLAVGARAASAMGWAHEYSLESRGSPAERADSRRDRLNNARSLRYMSQTFPHGQGTLKWNVRQIALVLRSIGSNLYNHHYFVRL